jgi:energy-coupling factor transporter transmembrane protein EcfT|tara:strand:- start:3411 stop:3662 length:252 start_codon:yes stop_codon:yes gene_type:complete
MTIKKATPTHTVDWYIKWVATMILIFGMMLTSNNVYPFNLFVHTIGLLGWLIVGILWNDRALIVINSVSSALLFNGLVKYYAS